MTQLIRKAVLLENLKSCLDVLCYEKDLIAFLGRILGQRSSGSDCRITGQDAGSVAWSLLQAADRMRANLEAMEEDLTDLGVLGEDYRE